MIKQIIPLITPEMYRRFPDQTTEILNRLITEVNDNQATLQELSNIILTLRQQIADLQPPEPTPPTPTGDWVQVVPFDINNMGSRPMWCLANVCEGFGFNGGIYNSAREDMNAQIANGTLHAGTPPADISVPIYYDNIMADGHAAVWDRGVVYSDKVMYSSIDAVTNGYMGWGELVNGHRVVERAS